MNKVDFDEFAVGYNDLLRESTGFFSEDASYFARYKVAITRSLVGTGVTRILEYGCGIGRNIAFLREAFPAAEIMGSDVSAKSLEIARAENPANHFWKEGEAEGEEHDFDLVFVAGVFHHIPPEEREHAAHTLTRRLRPGGSSVVFEHNPYNPVTQRIVSQCPYDKGVLLLRPKELRAHLSAASLRVRRQGYALFFPPRMKSLTRFEALLGWLPLGGQYWVHATKTAERS